MPRGMTAFWAIALSATAFVSTANPVHGAEPLTDPSKACQHLGELVAERDPGQAVDAMVEMSDGKLNRGQAVIAIGQIDAFKSALGDLHLADFMAERTYGERVRRYWYVLLFENQPAYVHCQFVRLDESWQLVDFDFNTDINKIPIP